MRDFVVFDTTFQLSYTDEVLRDVVFDWDQWNIQKNEKKHGVSQMEAESAFFDLKYKLYQDRKHSSKRELRYILYGKSLENRVLMVGFTLRKLKVRIITARPASIRERKVYEK